MVSRAELDALRDAATAAQVDADLAFNMAGRLLVGGGQPHLLKVAREHAARGAEHQESAHRLHAAWEQARAEV